MAVEPTVFIVDDEVVLGDATRTLFEANGMRAEVFESAEKFLESYDPARPGCLLLDIRLPQMSGLELLRKLRTDGSQLPVVLVSGYADERMIAEAQALGAFAVLHKPLAPDELLQHVWRALGSAP